MNTRPHPHRTRRRRSTLGAVMVETVLITPVLMVVIVLIMYLGWQVRRLQNVTNMDRYEVWRQTTPGSVGPPRGSALNNYRPLNDALYGDTNDQARQITQAPNHGRTAPQEAYNVLQQQTYDETAEYLNVFLGSSPTSIYERFEARHNQISPYLARYMSDMSRNRAGHRRLNGDWRYANGVTYSNRLGRWVPAGYRVSPAEPLRDIFFVEFDQGLSPYVATNNLADRIDEFYSRYPGYRGPDIPLMR